MEIWNSFKHKSKQFFSPSINMLFVRTSRMISLASDSISKFPCELLALIELIELKLTDSHNGNSSRR